MGLAFLPVRPVMGSSIAANLWWWLAAAIQRLKKPCILSNIAKPRHLVHRRDKLKSEKFCKTNYLKNKNGNVTIEWNSQVKEVVGDDAGVTGVVIETCKTSLPKPSTPLVCSWRLGINPTPIFSKISLRWIMAISWSKAVWMAMPRRQVSKACLPVGMWADHRQAITSAGTGQYGGIECRKIFRYRQSIECRYHGISQHPSAV